MLKYCYYQILLSSMLREQILISSMLREQILLYLLSSMLRKSKYVC